MRRLALPILAALSWFAAPAMAHEADYLLFRPYAIEKTCNDHGWHCKARMIYAPGQHGTLSKSGSYWYQRHPGAKRHGDFVIKGGSHHAGRKVIIEGRAYWCKRHGAGFNTPGESFAGLPHDLRCIPAYDRQ